MRLSISAALVCLAVATATPALGKKKPETVKMVASWYECCKTTADGTPFSAENLRIAAHRTLAFGTKLLLRREKGKGKPLCVTVRDRGPFVAGKQLDVTRAAARYLGFKEAGKATLVVTIHGC